MKKTLSRVRGSVASFISQHPRWSILTGIVILIIVVMAFAGGGSSSAFETASVTRGDVAEEVSVTGKVVPVQKVDLAFEKGGLVAGVYVKVGDHVTAGKSLGGLEVGEIYATLVAEEARLSELRRGTRPEELAVASTKASNSERALADAETSAANAVRDAYIKVEDAFINNVDTFFEHPTSPNPTITLTTPSREVEKNINAQRVQITNMLATWAKELTQLTSTNDVEKYIASTRNHIAEAKRFFDALNFIFSELSNKKTGLSESQLAEYREIFATGQNQIIAAGTSLSSAESTLTSAQSAARVAQNELSLSQSGSTPEAIKIQEAKVLQARSALSKASIISPIDGIVAQVMPKVGEILSGGQVAFTIISDNAYQIEVQIPEADIAHINAGDTAEITLDAYGKGVIFLGTVSQVDPAETIVEGVPTYKVTVQFSEKDSRVRSGMTANIDIVSDTRSQVLLVPTRAVIDRGGEKVVRVPGNDLYIEKPIETGVRGSNGFTEVISGLSFGDTVVTFVK